MCANRSSRSRPATFPRHAARLTRRRFLTACSALALLAIWPSPAVAADTGYSIVTKKTKTIHGVYSFDIHAPHSTAKAWVIVAAQAPELPGQRQTATRLFPGGQTCLDLGDEKRLLLRAEVPANDAALEHSLRARIEWQATLYSRTLVRRSPGQSYPPAEKLSPPARELWLAETPTLNFSTDVFQRWLRGQHLVRRSGESDLDFARRAFLAIRHAYHYHYAEEMDRHATFVCQQNAADCGGMSILYVATLRSNGVPARVLFGRWAKSAKPGATLEGAPYHQQHIKSEFYAEGIGWVPADLSRAVTADKTPEGLRFFGSDGGDFLTVHVDPDLEFDSGLFGTRTLPYLQSFHYYARGSGKFNGLKCDVDWKVEEGQRREARGQR